MSYVALGAVVDFSDEPMVITVPKPPQSDAIVFTLAESEAAFAKPSSPLPWIAGAGILALLFLG